MNLYIISCIFIFFLFILYICIKQINKYKQKLNDLLNNKKIEECKRLESEVNKKKQELDNQFLQYENTAKEKRQLLEQEKNALQQIIISNREIIRREEEKRDLVLNQGKESIQRDLDKYQSVELEKIKKIVADEEQRERQLLAAKLQQELFKVQEQTDIANEELAQLQNILKDHRARIEVINEAIAREKEKTEQQDFYRVVIHDSDKEDIEIIRSIAPKLKNREAISKLIWDVFVQRPASEMCKRIINGKDISGIYKITYIPTGEAYIGKTTNFKQRWINHLKTVIGLEGAAHSSLHTHMEDHGFWNYTFEILEEVPKDRLSEREAFWIDFYDTTKQLNMKRGSNT